jgi:hypothetical protein
VRRYPGEHLPHAEWLDDVVVSTDLKSDHAIDLGAPGTCDDDWARHVPAQQTAGLEAVHASRQLDIKDDQVR